MTGPATAPQAAADAAAALARADLCRYLSACYYEPTPMFAEERLFDSMHDAARRLDPGLADATRSLGEAYAAVDVQTLLVDYTRLFLGPVHPRALPYGSVWLGDGHTLMHESTADVLELYRAGGFALDEDFRDLPDHVAVELEFLYGLLLRAEHARAAGDAAAAGELVRLQRRLLDDHLGRWIDRFTAAMHAGAETDFYRTLAQLTRHGVRASAAGTGGG